MKLTAYVCSYLFLMLCITNKTIAQKQGQERIDSLVNNIKNFKSACTQPCVGDSSKIRSLLLLGREYIFRNKDSAVLFNNQALEFAKQINWRFGIAASYHSIAYAFEKAGDNDSALNYYLKALQIADQIEIAGSKNEKAAIKISKSRALGNAGYIYTREGDYLTGLDYYFQSLKIETDLNNKPGISKDLILIGEAFDEQGESQKALDYNFKALEIERELKDPNRLSALLGNIGIIYTSLNDYDKALQYYTEGLNAAEAFGDKSRIGGMLADIGEIYFKKIDFKKSEEYLFKGLELAKAANDKNTLSQIMNDIGKIYLETKKYSEAKKYLYQGLVFADSAKDESGTISLYENLSEVFLDEGDYKKAIEYYKNAVILKDTLFNEKKNKEITQKEMTYEFNKKQDSTKAAQDKKDAITQQEISKQKLIRNSILGSTAGIALIGFLGFRNFRNKRKREKAELSLQVSETEMKALRAQMDPHFIFNALGSIQSFLLNNQPADANIYLLKFKELIRLVLENSTHQQVALAEDMKTLELYMQLENIRMTNPFSYNFQIDKKINVEQTEIPVLILQPFIENAIWHGLQPKTNPGGCINVTINESNNNLICIVQDNGAGRNHTITEKNLPFKKESLGIKLTEERLKIINAVKKVKAYFTITDLFTPDNKPCGTRVELVLPFSS